jgi:hypothetical protein
MSPMKDLRLAPLPICLTILCAVLLFPACGQNPPTADAAPPKPARHEHKPPHGGTPVALGDDAYHLELVRDAATGTLQAYVFDGELENFIRCSAPSFEVLATVNGVPQSLLFKPVANALTGETAGDTSLFEAQADWLKTSGEFEALLKTLAIRGSTFSDVKFNFPKGNDRD